ncbi:uncharacterized protein LOC135221156 [Macrobrachium nipponense]|uniref:uncharacterized protein LOC135221156 n=1 Tax=Macrobrachium nipponense TaxID=159736 RepID=UPI0030C856E4
MIYAPQLMTYSEEKLVEELKDQGIIRIERMKKKINGVLVPLPNLIVTFNSSHLLSIEKAAGLRFKVKQYIPRPRRCFHCQEFGHMLGSCRQKLQGKPATCVKCSEPEHGICNKQARCIYCGDSHPSSSLTCDVYIMEKEIQTLRVTERITFREAKERVLNQYVILGISFSSVAANQRRKTNVTKNNVSKKPVTTCTHASLEEVPVIVGACASLEAVPVISGAPASLEAAPVISGAPASSEAVPVDSGD